MQLVLRNGIDVSNHNAPQITRELAAAGYQCTSDGSTVSITVSFDDVADVVDIMNNTLDKLDAQHKNI